LEQLIVTARDPSLTQVNLKKYQNRCQCALMPRNPSHIATKAAICWMLFGLRCWSCSPYANNTSRMNRPAGTEKPRSWKATNDTTYPLGGRGTDSLAGTIHSMASVRGGSWPASTRRRSYSWEMLERVQFDISAAKSWTSFKRE
jgi:hypothetical protein